MGLAVANNADRTMPEAFTGMMLNWQRWAAGHRRRFNAPIGDDAVAGPAWQAIGYQLIKLLDFQPLTDTAGCDRFIRETLRQNGCDPDL